MAWLFWRQIVSNRPQPVIPQIDRLLTLLRWLLLLGVLAYAALALRYIEDPRVNDHLDAYMPNVLAGGLIYNLLATVVFWVWPAQSNRYLSAATLALDVGLVGLLYWASAGNVLLMVSVGVFPVLVAWLRYGWPTGVLVTSACALIEGVLFLVTPRDDPDNLAVIGAIFLGLIGLMSGVLHRRLLSGGDRPRSDPEVEAQLLRAARERTRAIYEMASTLNATLEYGKVLEAALEMGALGLRDAGPDPEMRLISCVLLFREDSLYVATSRRLTRSDQNVVIEGKRGVVGMALKQAEPVFAADPHHDPELRYFAAFQECRSLVVIPLRAGFDNYGVLVFGAEERDAFDEEAVELLSAIGTQATIALKNASLYGSIMQEKERIVEVEEEARKKLARDLHDGPTQSVAAIAMRVNFTRRLLEREPAQVPDELWKVEELARKTTKEIRHLLFTLRPLVLESQGLVAALEQLAEKMKDTHDQNVIVQVKPGCEEMLDTHAQGVIFYIVEEAVNNARKHAQAEHVWVRLYTHNSYMVVEVQDDGVGFDIEATKASYEKRGSQSLGLINMLERAELIEGQLHMESAPGKGTTIRALIPLDSSHVSRGGANGPNGKG